MDAAPQGNATIYCRLSGHIDRTPLINTSTPIAPTIIWSAPSSIILRHGFDEHSARCHGPWTVNGVTLSVAGILDVYAGGRHYPGRWQQSDALGDVHAQRYVRLRVRRLQCADRRRGWGARQDTTTEGNWIGEYGSQGYDILGASNYLPNAASPSTAGCPSWANPGTANATNALQVPPSGTSRIADVLVVGDEFYVATST